MGEKLTPMPVAHRGCWEDAPENTMAAFRAAAERGCCVETDIRMTRDGEIVIFHDPNLTRLCRGLPDIPDIPVEQMSLAQLQSFRLPCGGHISREFFPRGGYQLEEWYYYPWGLDSEENILRAAEEYESFPPDERVAKLAARYGDAYEKACRQDGRAAFIPTLREFLAWVAAQPEGFFAEIEYKGLGMTEKVFRLLEETGAAGKCILMSGDLRHVAEMQQTAAREGKPEGLRFGANIRWCDDSHLALLQGYDLWEVGLNAGAFGAEDVKRLAGRGIRVFANLGDTPEWWETLVKTGAEAFKTNCLSRYLEWRAGQSE